MTTMNSVRSEYSESSVASSRLGDGSSSGRSRTSFSISRSYSHASGLSIDSASTRSDYLSNYEQKFLERKAAKHRRTERAKKERERENREQLVSAEQKRQADREVERQARRREMETWLTDPKELRRIERRTQKRSRDRMRALQEWYLPASTGPTDELKPVFVAAMKQQEQEQQKLKEELQTRQSDNQELPKSRRRCKSLLKPAKPLLPEAEAAAREEEEREAFQATLQRQLADFRMKLSYLEEHAVSSSAPAVLMARSKTRAAPRSRRRRVMKETLQLEPISPAVRAGLQGARSQVDLRRGYVIGGAHRRTMTASASLQLLQGHGAIGLTDEEMMEAQDDAELQEFLARHRQGAKQGRAARLIQATWRMFCQRRVYQRWRLRRTAQRRAIFELWTMTHRVAHRAHRSLARKYFLEWRDEVALSLQLRAIELQLFRTAATQAELPRMVLNLVFTSDWDVEWGRRKTSVKSVDPKDKSTKPTAGASLLGAFLNSAFAGVEQTSDTRRGRVQQLRAQHLAAREEVLKKVVQRVFRRWKRAHEAQKRVGLNAQLCLKRAARMAFGSRRRWPAETLLAAFDIWARWAAFSRCKRLGVPLPPFAQANPQWDVWLHNYQERQVRCVKAAAKAPNSRLRRFFWRVRDFTRHAVATRRAHALSEQHFVHTLTRGVLRAWRAAIADSATEKKLTRQALTRLHRYARAKRKLRPLKRLIRQARQDFTTRRAWRAWQRVQLHACFKRELNLARLENSQTWRRRLHRTLALWRDERETRALWRTFEAWVHVVRKRKLFLTLRKLCARLQRRHLLFGILTAWKSAVWDRSDAFLEDRLRLDAWDAYRELSAFFPELFYGCFSDAGAIFGGLPSSAYSTHDSQEPSSSQQRKQDEQELLLATSGDGVRHFHSVLVHESVVEVRNMILQARHLVNAVDDASGNTALHVAAQLEEPARRLEVLGLLLSEGAATHQRANRHGLTPAQLAPDSDTQLLLAKGISAFHSRDILKVERAPGSKEKWAEGPPQRLLWCVAALMSSEWVTGQRIAADARTGQWHSLLREELWIRQDRIGFAPDSTFAPVITRSKGFLNGLKTRLCRSEEELLQASRPSKPLVALSEDAEVARQRRYSEWEAREKIRHARARTMGEYEAYVRYLLATTLDADAAEQALVPSFVGVLFSLEFSVDEVLNEAFRLEELCTAGEVELWELHQRLKRAEAAWRTALAPTFTHNQGAMSDDVALLRLFSEEADADFFFRQQLFFLDFARLREAAKHDPDGWEHEALTTELDNIMTRAQRKLRKAEKKIKRVQDQIDESERTYRAALFASTRCVQAICVARMALERTRLRMAAAMIKHCDIQAVVSRLEAARLELQQEEGCTPDSASESPKAESTPDRTNISSSLSDDRMSTNERKDFLEEEMARYSGLFQARVLLEESQNATKREAEREGKPMEEIEALPEPLDQLQKEAVSKLHTLFVTNLFRNCCCWLAENLITTLAAEEVELDSGASTARKPTNEDCAADKQRDTAKKTEGLTRLLTAAGAIPSQGTVRRRSSLTNARRVLETYHRGSVMDMLDPDSETMQTTYTASAGLLFEEERRAEQEAERERSSAAKDVAVTTFLERNPVTNELEVPPVHLVNIDELLLPEAVELPPPETTGDRPRNRKKQELYRALLSRQRERKERGEIMSDSDEEDRTDISGSNTLPVIRGDGFEFGNFVIGNGLFSEPKPSRANTPAEDVMHQRDTETLASGVSAESMWKRGGVRLMGDAATSSIKEVVASARVLNTPTDNRFKSAVRRGVALEQQALSRRVLSGIPTTEAPQSTSLEPTPCPVPKESVEEECSPSRQRTESSTELTEQPNQPVEATKSMERDRAMQRSSSQSLLSMVQEPIAMPSLPVTPIEVEGQVKETVNHGASGDQRPQPMLKKPREHLCIPAVQINTRSKQSSVLSTRSTTEDSPAEGTSGSPTHRQGPAVETEETQHNQQDQQDQEDAFQEESPHITIDGDNHSTQAHEEDETLRKFLLQARISPVSPQSPVVEAGTSPPADATLRRDGTRRSSDSSPLQSPARPREVVETYPTTEASTLAETVSPFIKWEEATALESFPLAIGPGSRPKFRNVRSSHSQQRLLHSWHAGGSRSGDGGGVDAVGGGGEECVFENFGLSLCAEESEASECPSDDSLALRGVSMTMPEKRGRVGISSAGGANAQATPPLDVEALRARQLKHLEAAKTTRTPVVSGRSAPGSASSSQLKPSIKVTVVTKSAELDEEGPVSTERAITPASSRSRLATLEKPATPFSGLRLKTQRSVRREGEDETQPPKGLQLRLEVVGLKNSSSAPAIGTVATPTRSKEQASDVGKLGGASPAEEKASNKCDQGSASARKLVDAAARSSRASARPHRSRGSLTSASCGDLLLEGARVATPNSGGRRDYEQTEQSGKDGLRSLSKQQKERVWKEFVAAPLSTSVQNAYAALYPQTYSSIATAADATEVEVPPLSIAELEPSASFASEHPIAHIALRVDPAPQSKQRSMEQNRKFWSAVEGYRAIGTSSLVPLDAATVARRRRDKAEAIYDQFFRGQRSVTGNGGSGGAPLDWLAMYPKEVSDVRKQLATAPSHLFDSLQQTAQLQISAALSRHQED